MANTYTWTLTVVSNGKEQKTVESAFQHEDIKSIPDNSGSLCYREEKRPRNHEEEDRWINLATRLSARLPQFLIKLDAHRSGTDDECDDTWQFMYGDILGNGPL